MENSVPVRCFIVSSWHRAVVVVIGREDRPQPRGSRFPPLITHTTRCPAIWSRHFIAAAMAAPPAPSARLCVRSSASAHAVGELLFAQQHEVVEPALQDAKRQIEGDARRDAFGKRVGRRADDARAGPPRTRHGAARSAPTPTMRVFRPSASRTVMRPQAPLPPPIGHEHGVDVCERLEDFERVGADAAMRSGSLAECT